MFTKLWFSERHGILLDLIKTALIHDILVPRDRAGIFCVGRAC